MPAGLAERQDVGDGDHVPESRESVGRDRSKVGGRLVAQGVEQIQSPLLPEAANSSLSPQSFSSIGEPQ
jgi:hypothetical protein